MNALLSGKNFYLFLLKMYPFSAKTLRSLRLCGEAVLTLLKFPIFKAISPLSRRAARGCAERILLSARAYLAA
jgi:hypothetical protein